MNMDGVFEILKSLKTLACLFSDLMGGGGE